MAAAYSIQEKKDGFIFQYNKDVKKSQAKIAHDEVFTEKS